MPTTVAAHDLGALHAERAVCVPRHGARHSVEESGPAAPAAELLPRFVEGRAAAGAGVCPGGGGVLVVGAGVGGLGALLAKDAELLLGVR